MKAKEKREKDGCQIDEEVQIGLHEPCFAYWVWCLSDLKEKSDGSYFFGAYRKPKASQPSLV